MQGGGGMQGICWVAREVYGVSNPRWLLFRDWLQADAPQWLYSAYACHGQAFAAWIHDRPFAKSVVRFLMDLVLLTQAVESCPASE